jgi:hypothetical protein
MPFNQFEADELAQNLLYGSGCADLDVNFESPKLPDIGFDAASAEDSGHNAQLDVNDINYNVWPDIEAQSVEYNDLFVGTDEDVRMYGYHETNDRTQADFQEDSIRKESVRDVREEDEMRPRSRMSLRRLSGSPRKSQMDVVNPTNAREWHTLSTVSPRVLSNIGSYNLDVETVMSEFDRDELLGFRPQDRSATPPALYQLMPDSQSNPFSIQQEPYLYQPTPNLGGNVFGMPTQVSTQSMFNPIGYGSYTPAVPVPAPGIPGYVDTFIDPFAETGTYILGQNMPNAPLADNPSRRRSTDNDQSQRRGGMHLRKNSSSSGSRDSVVSVILQSGDNVPLEKPRLDPARPNVRINAVTKGKTKRTGKINNFDARQAYPKDYPSPVGKWRSESGITFRYCVDGKLRNLLMSAKKIRDFIYDHPKSTKGKKMVLWISKSPADSARRYINDAHSKCCFEACPSVNRTIVVGHLRVVFDEKWNTHSEKADPFHAAAFAHLYCMERFLDFPEICSLDNVEVKADDRAMKREMDATNKAGLDAGAFKRVSEFLRSIKKQKFHMDFPDYPEHEEGHTLHVEEKPYEHTLSAICQKVMNANRSYTAQKNFEYHMGDLAKVEEKRILQRDGNSEKSRAKIDQAIELANERGRQIELEVRRDNTSPWQLSSSTERQWASSEREDSAMDDEIHLTGSKSRGLTAEDFMVRVNQRPAQRARDEGSIHDDNNRQLRSPRRLLSLFSEVEDAATQHRSRKHSRDQEQDAEVERQTRSRTKRRRLRQEEGDE